MTLYRRQEGDQELSLFSDELANINGSNIDLKPEEVKQGSVQSPPAELPYFGSKKQQQAGDNVRLRGSA